MDAKCFHFDCINDRLLYWILLGDSFGYQLWVIQLVSPRWHLVCLFAAALHAFFTSLLCACLDDGNTWLL